MARALALTLIFALSIPLAAGAQDGRAEARERFERGVELFDEGRFEQALVEFEQAYNIAPAAPVLFNVAQVHAALGHAVEAVLTYRRYLAEGGAAISAERRRLVDAEITRLTARIAHLSIRTSVLGATVSIDDVDVGSTPLDPVDVTAGEHVVAARAPGFETLRRRIRIAGGVTEELHLELTATGASFASVVIASRVPGVEVLVDGSSIGLTPFDASVAVGVGPHRIEGRRAGYRTVARDVELVAGSQTSVDLALEPDAVLAPELSGVLHLTLPDTRAVVRIDGREVPPSTTYGLPIGPHDVSVEAADREPVHARVELVHGQTAELAPRYRWTVSARQRRAESAAAMRDAGIGLLVPGVLLAGAGVALVIVAEDTRAPIAGLRNALQICATGNGTTCSDALSAVGFPATPFTAGDVEREVTAYTARRIDEYTAYAVSGGVALGLGVALGITGAVLLGTAPWGDLASAEEEATAWLRSLRVGIGAGTVTLSGEL